MKKNQKTFNAGFVLTPVILLLVISLLVILVGSKELYQSVLMHQLKLHQDCVLLVKQLSKTKPSNYDLCPPCNKNMGCLDETSH